MASVIATVLLVVFSLVGIVTWVTIRRAQSINRRREKWLSGSERY